MNSFNKHLLDKYYELGPMLPSVGEEKKKIWFLPSTSLQFGHPKA